MLPCSILQKPCASYSELDWATWSFPGAARKPLLPCRSIAMRSCLNARARSCFLQFDNFARLAAPVESQAICTAALSKLNNYNNPSAALAQQLLQVAKLAKLRHCSKQAWDIQQPMKGY